MMDMSGVAAVSTHINAGLQIAKALLGMKIDSEVLAKTTELQGVLASAMGKMLELQGALHAQHERVRELEAQLARQNDFDAQAALYELKEIGNGSYAYALKMPPPNGQPAPWLCAHCFGRREKSILQFHRPTLGRRIYACPTCKTEASVPVEPAGVTIETAGPRRLLRDLDDYVGR